jgi:HTH-type transcriptional repressor of NAD biosynthesis genes
MPPHGGHVFLCDFAKSHVEELTILVCSLPDDTIPGHLRHAWMEELFPDCRIRSCSENVPQVPADDPARFWDIWRGVVMRYHPEPIDLVFASEAYGQRLADEVGARFVPCDIARAARPCSGSAIRADPFEHWDFIPAPVRPFFAKRVCTFGPESSGKTTLARDLGRHFGTVVVPEYGRTYTETFGTALNAEDLRRIAEGHLASVAAAGRQANRIVIEDTDPVLTAVWSDMLLGACEQWLDDFDDYADLYVLCGISMPWEDDGTRYFPTVEQRQRFFALCEAELTRRSLPYVRVEGNKKARLERSVAEIERRFRMPRRG